MNYIALVRETALRFDVYFTCLSSQYFDDEAREIRARVDSLLRRVHVFIPRAVARYLKGGISSKHQT